MITVRKVLILPASLPLLLLVHLKCILFKNSKSLAVLYILSTSVHNAVLVPK